MLARPLIREQRIKWNSALNLDFDEWADAFPNKMLGAATIDCLRHGAHKIVLDGESYRSPRPSEETPKPTVAKRVKKH